MITIKTLGLDAAAAALDKIARTDIPNATENMLTVMLQAVSAHAMVYIPVDTSALINSQVRNVAQTSTGYSAYIAYGAPGAAGAKGTPVQDYAIYVHEGPQKNWQKPGASNKYLAHGADDFMADDLADIVKAFTE